MNKCEGEGLERLRHAPVLLAVELLDTLRVGELKQGLRTELLPLAAVLDRQSACGAHAVHMRVRCACCAPG